MWRSAVYMCISELFCGVLKFMYIIIIESFFGLLQFLYVSVSQSVACVYQ